jgi:hypothetical protein
VRTLSRHINVWVNVQLDRVSLQVGLILDSDDDSRTWICTHLDRAWDLADFPQDTTTLRDEILDLLREFGRIRQDERLASMIVLDVARFVSTAREERKRQLTGLPPPAPVMWGELTHLPGTAERCGVLDVRDGVIELRLLYCCEDLMNRPTPSMDVVIVIVSTRAGVRRVSRVPLSADGVCSQGMIQTLETWSWSSELSTSLAYAAALTAREDWLPLRAERDERDRADLERLTPKRSD